MGHQTASSPSTKRRPGGDYSAAWRDLAYTKEEPREEPAAPWTADKETVEEMLADMYSRINKCQEDLSEGWKDIREGREGRGGER